MKFFALTKVDGYMHDVTTEIFASHEEAEKRMHELIERLTAFTLDELLETGEAEYVGIDENSVNVYYLGDEYDYTIEEVEAPDVFSFPLTSSFHLVAKKNGDEIVVGIKTPLCWWQNLVVVGPRKKCDDDGNVVDTFGRYTVKVYTDEKSDDYTQAFNIPLDYPTE